VEAAAAGKFHVFAVKTVDEALELLFGVPAGVRGEDGRFPEDTVNGRVERQLERFAEFRKRFLEQAKEAK
jgi:predicted ATP-dependent protease